MLRGNVGNKGYGPVAEGVLRWQGIVGAAIATLGVSVFGCAPAPAPTTGALTVVATTGMVADVVRAVGGDHVTVRTLIGPGVDPHLHSPTRDDAAAILSADIVFYSGLHLEGKMGEVLASATRSTKAVGLAESLPPSLLLHPEENARQHDPHVWMDASLWAQTVPSVVRALSEIRPALQSTFETRGAEYVQQLEDLHATGLRLLSTIPRERRLLVTSHDAFRYFGRAYGLEVQAIQGISTESEAGLSRVNELVDLLVQRQVPAVFIESTISPKSIRALIDSAAARGHPVRIGGELFADALGRTGSPEETYVGMLAYNLRTIAQELGGTGADEMIESDTTGGLPSAMGLPDNPAQPPGESSALTPAGEG